MVWLLNRFLPLSVHGRSDEGETSIGRRNHIIMTVRLIKFAGPHALGECREHSNRQSDNSVSPPLPHLIQLPWVTWAPSTVSIPRFSFNFILPRLFISHRNIAQIAEISVSALGLLEGIDKYKKWHLETGAYFGKVWERRKDALRLWLWGPRKSMLSCYVWIVMKTTSLFKGMQQNAFVVWFWFLWEIQWEIHYINRSKTSNCFSPGKPEFRIYPF